MGEPKMTLDPCPFCGGDPVFRQGEMESLFWVECSRCEIGTKYYQYQNEYDALQAWNRRASPTKEEMEYCKECDRMRDRVSRTERKG